MLCRWTRLAPSGDARRSRVRSNTHVGGIVALQNGDRFSPFDRPWLSGFCRVTFLCATPEGCVCKFQLKAKRRGISASPQSAFLGGAWQLSTSRDVGAKSRTRPRFRWKWQQQQRAGACATWSWNTLGAWCFRGFWPLGQRVQSRQEENRVCTAACRPASRGVPDTSRARGFCSQRGWAGWGGFGLQCD